MSNPHKYEANWTIEQHRDELIERLGKAIKRINELEAELRGMERGGEGHAEILANYLEARGWSMFDSDDPEMIRLHEIENRVYAEHRGKSFTTARIESMKAVIRATLAVTGIQNDTEIIKGVRGALAMTKEALRIGDYSSAAGLVDAMIYRTDAPQSGVDGREK